jgi:hypothetical protein
MRALVPMIQKDFWWDLACTLQMCRLIYVSEYSASWKSGMSLVCKVSSELHTCKVRA